MDDASAFLDRVFAHLPAVPSSGFDFNGWNHAGRPTKEGVGLLAISGFDVDKVISRIMDLDHYKGNIDHVVECRIVSDPAYSPPKSARFYQRVHVPVLGDIQMELVLRDLGERDGWRVAAWDMHPNSAKLDPKKGARGDYNVGAWLIRNGCVGYALSSAPLKSDVGRLKYAALTKGADAGATKVVRNNIEGMVAWSRRA